MRRRARTPDLLRGRIGGPDQVRAPITVHVRARPHVTSVVESQLVEAPRVEGVIRHRPSLRRGLEPLAAISEDLPMRRRARTPDLLRVRIGGPDQVRASITVDVDDRPDVTSVVKGELVEALRIKGVIRHRPSARAGLKARATISEDLPIWRGARAPDLLRGRIGGPDQITSPIAIDVDQRPHLDPVVPGRFVEASAPKSVIWNRPGGGGLGKGRARRDR